MIFLILCRLRGHRAVITSIFSARSLQVVDMGGQMSFKLSCSNTHDNIYSSQRTKKKKQTNNRLTRYLDLSLRSSCIPPITCRRPSTCHLTAAPLQSAQTTHTLASVLAPKFPHSAHNDKILLKLQYRVAKPTNRLHSCAFREFHAAETQVALFRLVHLRIRAKMVYYFSSNTVEPAGFIYVGKDKFESEMPT